MGQHKVVFMVAFYHEELSNKGQVSIGEIELIDLIDFTYLTSLTSD